MAHTKVRTRGKVKWFDTVKGFGYLTREGNAPVFLHIGSVARHTESLLKPGADVEFTMEVTKFGPVATEATVMKR